MRVLNKFAGVVLALLAVGAGGWSLRHGVAGAAALSPLAVIAGALALLALGATYLVTALAPRRRRHLTFDNEGGTVNISTDAICDSVARLAPEFPSIVRLVPHVAVGRGRMDVIVGVRIQGGPQIHETCELLQQRVREQLVTGLGITQVRKVEVNVTDIVGEKRET